MGGIAVHVFLEVWSARASLPGGRSAFNPCSTQPCGAQRVAKVIHQTYKTDTLPPEWRATPAAWKRHHPGWRYMFWTDAKNRALVEKHYPEHLATYDAYPHAIQRADAARYFILHRYGGVYADLDIRPERNIGPMLGDAQVLLPQTPNIGLTNAFMAAEKGHPFFAHVITQLASYQHAWYHVMRHWEIVTSTGPTFIWSVFDRYPEEKKQGIVVVPAPVWGKCSICKTACRVTEYGNLRHLVGDSWHKWDSFIINYVILCNFVPLAITIYVIVSVFVSVRAAERKAGARWRPAARVGMVFNALFTRETLVWVSVAVMCWHYKRRP